MSGLKYFLAIILIVLTGFLIEHSEWLSSQRVSAFSTVVIAFLTLFLVYDSNKTRRWMCEQAIRPVIIFRQSQEPNSNNSYSIYLENKGVGIALNIKVTASEPAQTGPNTTGSIKLSSSQVCRDKDNLRDAIEKCNIFNREILFLSPNQEMEWTIDPPVGAWFYTMKVTVSFEDAEGKKYSIIDYMSFLPDLRNY